MRPGRTPLLATAAFQALGVAAPALELAAALQASFEEGVRALKAAKPEKAGAP